MCCHCSLIETSNNQNKCATLVSWLVNNDPIRMILESFITDSYMLDTNMKSSRGVYIEIVASELLEVSHSGSF